MFTTCGQLVEVGAPQHPAEPGDPRVVLGGPLVDQLAGRPRRHRAELEDRERLRRPCRPAPGGRSSGPRLPTQVAEPHERASTSSSTTQPDERQRDVDDPLGPAVAGAVHLADVEQQRRPLELGDRQLAEPLLVEQRQRAHPHARARAARRPGPRRRGAPAPRGRARATVGSRPSSSSSSGRCPPAPAAASTA